MDAPQKFADRMRLLLGRDGNRNAFARDVGVNPSTFRTYFEGSVPAVDTAARIARSKGVSLVWLATGDGPMRSGEAPIQSQTMVASTELPSGYLSVPLVDVRPSAGAGTIALRQDAEPDVYAFRESWLRHIGVTPSHARLMIAKGDSMYPTIKDGDLMIVDESIREIVDDGIYVVVVAGMVRVKRVQILRTRTLLLKSDNDFYRPEEVQPHELHELSVAARVRWSGGVL